MLKYRGALALIALLMLSAVGGVGRQQQSSADRRSQRAAASMLVGRVGGGESAPLGAHLDYYGGRVVSNMQVIQVLWGTGAAGTRSGQILAQVRDTSTPSIATFYQQVLNSPYVDWLSRVQHRHHRPRRPRGYQSEHRPRFFFRTGRHHAVGPFQSDRRQGIQTELVKRIIAGHIPAPTTDAVGNVNTSTRFSSRTG